MPTQAEIADSLQETASNEEAPIREIVVGAFVSIFDKIVLSELTAALNDEDELAAEEATHIGDLSDELTPITVGLLAALVAGANSAKTELPASMQVAVRAPDALADAVQEWVRFHAAETISGITETSRQAIREAIARAIESPDAARRAAREIRSFIGLTAPQQSALQKFRQAMTEAGVKKDLIEQRLAERADNMRAYRAKVIAETESFTAVSMGRQLYWMQLADEGELDDGALRKWYTALDERVCPICRPMHGQVRGLREAFTTGGGGSVLTSPAHPVCRCAVLLVSPQPPEA